jgi:manganese/iron transport system ATP-binding protein
MLQSLSSAPQAAAAVSSAAAISVDRLTLGYEQGVVLDAVSLDIAVGEQVAIIGPNGAGKSSLCKAIAGLVRGSEGSISYFGSASAPPGLIAYVPQRAQVDWRFPVTVSDVVMMGRVGRIGLFRRPGPRDRELVQRALEQVGLADLAGRRIGHLSGGQQQRVFLARALAQEARILLMDEPLTGLDIPSQEEIFRLLGLLRERGVTVLTALHDLQAAARHFDRVLLLNRHVVGYGAAADVFTAARLVEAYGGHLHLAVSGEGLLTVADSCCDSDVAASDVR